MVPADVARVLLAVLLVFAQSHLVAVYAVAFGLSAAGVLFNPAAASVLPALVEDEELVAANVREFDVVSGDLVGVYTVDQLDDGSWGVHSVQRAATCK